MLLPPSEGKAVGGTTRWRPSSGAFGRRLGGHRQAVIDALGRTELTSRHLGVTGSLLERANGATQQIVDGRAKARPADRRYTGVVWEHLDPHHDLDDDQRRRILVPSALLGLVTAADPVPDHRLKFDVSLPGVGRLDRYWRATITDALRHRASATFVELLPLEHRAAIDLDALARSRKHTLVRTTFTGTTGHDAKAVKGKVARHLLDQGLSEASAAAFDWQGWRVDYRQPERLLIVSR